MKVESTEPRRTLAAALAVGVAAIAALALTVGAAQAQSEAEPKGGIESDDLSVMGEKRELFGFPSHPEALESAVAS